MADKKLSAYDVLSEMSGEDLIVVLKSLGEGKYQNANVKLAGIAEGLSKLSERGLAKTDLSNLSEKGKSAIKESAPGVPAGSIICFAGTKGTRFDNGGYFYCDGRAVSRSEYPDLFDAIGETYGKGDGVNTFNIPDFRGCFLRGCGRNSAPLGQQQGDAIRNIVGNASITNISASGDNALREDKTRDIHIVAGNIKMRPNAFLGNLSFDAARVVPVANENRPINFAVHYYIKY
ncbi:MAG: phage tail protein [Endomicrobium sp.]|jgi:microcystin-dependent protein|nr:phage tail protein [Endomicrobium sp.]